MTAVKCAFRVCSRGVSNVGNELDRICKDCLYTLLIGFKMPGFGSKAPKSLRSNK